MHLGSMAIVTDGHQDGRKLLSRLYVAHVGGAEPEIVLTERGKPYFSDSPVHFSISHTKKHVFCVLSDRPVGIDAEELDRRIDLRLAEKILSPKEYAQFQAAPDPRLALLTFWVLKEAAAKATGEGLRGYPNRTEFSLNDPRVSVMDGCLVAILEGEMLCQPF